MDFCGARPANIAKTEDKPRASITRRWWSAGPVRAFGACDRTPHVDSLQVTFESSKPRASLLSPCSVARSFS